MADYDPTRYLPLLDFEPSRETGRLRRNLSLLSFGVILIEILEVPFEELQLAGVPIMAGHEAQVTWIAVILFCYWAVMFALRMGADRGRRRENEHLLNEFVGPALAKHDELTAEFNSELGLKKLSQRELNELRRFKSAYEGQRKRTKAAEFMLKMSALGEWPIL